MPIFRGKNFVSANTDYKDSVRVALRTNFPLSSTTTIITGVTLNDKDRVLLAGQSLASQNGIYSWDSTTQQLTRANDSDSGVELTTGTRVYVEEGTYERTTWTLITTGPITIGSTSLIWAKESRIGPVDYSGTYGAENKAVIITVDDTGGIESISETDINIDGGTY